MSTRILWLVVSVVLAASLGAGPPPPLTAPPTPTVGPAGALALRQARELAARPPGPLQVTKSERGSGKAVAIVLRSNVWLSVINAPGQTGSAEAGFKLAPISFGAALRAQGMAHMALLDGEGPVKARVAVYEVGNPSPVAERVVDLTRDVPYGITISTPAFTMAAGKQYEVAGTCSLQSDTSGGVYHALAVVRNVQWGFPE